MNYLDVYFSRINYFGETEAERIKNSGIVQFEKWMATSPFTVLDLSVERGIYFSGIIQTSKDKEEQKLMYLYVANDIPIKVGDIMTWRQDDGEVEKWLLLQKIHKVHGTYQTFQIIKCNYLLKWIDVSGYLQKSWAYTVSSTDNKVKGNFRMWHSLISPQPNKYAEIIMPRPVFKHEGDREQLMRGINFIIEDEAWQVIECDWTSVEGIVYMSLTESKVNYQYDDRDIDIADTDRYKFPELLNTYKMSDTIIPEFNEGTFNQLEIEMRPMNFDYFYETNVDSEGNEAWYSALHPKQTGTCIIRMRLKNRPAVTQDIEVTIGASEDSAVFYIDGPDQLRLDRYGIYALKSHRDDAQVDESDSVVQGSIIEIQEDPNAKKKPSDYATLKVDQDGQFVLHANAQNKLGKLVLVSTYNGIEYTKTVEIIPLW